MVILHAFLVTVIVTVTVTVTVTATNRELLLVNPKTFI